MFVAMREKNHINRLVPKKCNSSASEMELNLFLTNLWYVIYGLVQDCGISCALAVLP